MERAQTKKNHSCSRSPTASPDPYSRSSTPEAVRNAPSTKPKAAQPEVEKKNTASSREGRSVKSSRFCCWASFYSPISSIFRKRYRSRTRSRTRSRSRSRSPGSSPSGSYSMPSYLTKRSPSPPPQPKHHRRGGRRGTDRSPSPEPRSSGWQQQQQHQSNVRKEKEL